MNKHEELILKYLDFRLSDSELKEFNNLLESDEKFREEFNNVKNNLNDLKINSRVEVEQTYFTNLMPKTRAKLERKKFNPYLKLAYTIPVLVLIFFLVKPSSQISTLENSLISFNEDELSALLENDDSAYINNYVSENLYEENSDIDYELSLSSLDFDNKIYSQISDESITDLNSYEIFDELNEEEIELVYKNIVDKKIL